MEPVSTTASFLTVLGAAGSTCKTLHNLILDLKDADHDIRLQCKKLRCLRTTITCLLQVCDRVSADFQLEPHLYGVDEFIHDIDVISAKLEKRRNSIGDGAVNRAMESCRWLLFDRTLKKFFDNLEHYNMIISHALWAAQFALLFQISAQTAAPIYPSLDGPYVEVVNPELLPNIGPVGRGYLHDDVLTPHKYSHPPSKPFAPLGIQGILARLPKTSEPAGMLSESRCQMHLGALQLTVQGGPAVTRQWTPSARVVYTAEGKALFMIFHSTRFVRARVTLRIFVSWQAYSSSGLSIRCNLNISKTIPLDNAYFYAIKMGDLGFLQRHISSGSLSISSTTPGGYTLLHCAASYGRTDILCMLIKNGAGVHTTNDRGETPLHIATKQGGYHECTRRLLELGADPCQPDSEGRTALHGFYNTTIAYLLQYHIGDLDTWAQDKRGMTILHYLSWSSRPRAQDLLRCVGMDTTSMCDSHSGMSSQLSIKDAQGKSILHYAAQRGNLDILNLLLSRPEAAILSVPDRFGRTLLHYATESSRTETIDIFIARNLDIDARDDKGRTVLHHACQWGNLKAVQHLISLGVGYQLNMVDHDKRTPMQLAKLYRCRTVLGYLEKLRPHEASSSIHNNSEDDKFSTFAPPAPEQLARTSKRINSWPSFSSFFYYLLPLAAFLVLCCFVIC